MKRQRDTPDDSADAEPNEVHPRLSLGPLSTTAAAPVYIVGGLQSDPAI